MECMDSFGDAQMSFNNLIAGISLDLDRRATLNSSFMEQNKHTQNEYYNHDYLCITSNSFLCTLLIIFMELILSLGNLP